MTETDPPPSGTESAAARLRAAARPPAVKAADKVDANGRAGALGSEKPWPASKSALAPAPARAGGTGPVDQAASAASQSRLPSNLDDAVLPASERKTNGASGELLGAAAIAKPIRAGESPKSLAEQPGSVAADSLNLQRLSRRSPQAALEPVMVEVPKRNVPAGDPFPPLSERLVAGAALIDSQNPSRITPRSPRAALEPDKVEMPARRSKSARHPFVVVGNAIISLLVLAAIGAGALLIFGKQRLEAPGPLAADRVVNIPHGSGIRDIADVLTREGVISQPWVFIGGVLVLKAREGLKAGEYQFKAHASLRDVVATIVEGRVVAHQITLPEGLTSEQIVARLIDDDILTGTIKEIPREGSLLPDTYNYSRGLTREQLIQHMQQAQQRVLKEIWERRSPDLPIKTPEQLVVLASLVEKETGKPEERSRVAAVFVNRLKQRMRLQSDPTIIYGLVGGKGTLGRPIMKSEIDQPTPYNTYQIDGLPPGPIANPGRAALEAAANPARTRELYFVADGTGGHVFAETYEQHLKNVARLRQAEAGQKDATTADPRMALSPQQAPADSAPSAPPRRPGHHK